MRTNHHEPYVHCTRSKTVQAELRALRLVFARAFEEVFVKSAVPYFGQHLLSEYILKLSFTNNL